MNKTEDDELEAAELTEEEVRQIAGLLCNGLSLCSNNLAKLSKKVNPIVYTMF